MKKFFKNLPLHNKIQEALLQIGYEVMTPVQSEVVEKLINEQNDLMVQAKTGSGKTLAYSLPLVELVEWEENKPQAIILAPTRELAEQIKNEILTIGRYKRIHPVAVYGKQAFRYQQMQLKQKTHIVIGTPGRLLDHIQKGTLFLDKIKYVVIDEADEMLHRGFIDQVEAIINELPTKKVMTLFSATMPDDIQQLAKEYMHNPEMIQVESQMTPKQITHQVLEVAHEDKYNTLIDLLTVENPMSSIIFCATKERVNQLCSDLYDLGLNVDKLQGDMNQEDRLEVMEDFKRGLFRYLIATDVAARGLDVDNIPLVVNFDVPYEKNTYIHRTGRTGRKDKEGKAITFITNRQQAVLNEIEEYIGFKLEPISAPSKEEVENNKEVFLQSHQEKLKAKKLKTDVVNESITKLYFNGGKKKKLRAVDFVGTICQIENVTAEDIGIITILDTCSYVEILNNKGNLVLAALKKMTIKGKQLKVHLAKK